MVQSGEGKKIDAIKRLAKKAAAKAAKAAALAKKIKKETGLGASDLAELALTHPKIQKKLGKKGEALAAQAVEAAKQKGFGKQKGGSKCGCQQGRGVSASPDTGYVPPSSAVWNPMLLALDPTQSNVPVVMSF